MKKLLFLFFAILSFASLQINAQDPFGSIEGTVSDAQGAVVQNATVTVKNAATNATRTATTNENGQYRILQLQPGFYEVSVTAANFKTSVVQSVQVQVGQSSASDIALEVGGQNETVTVTSSAEAQIERSDNTVSGVVNTIQIENLPLNGRNFLDLAQLQPGTEKVDGGSFDPTKANFTGVSIGGQAGRSTQITVDGGSVVDNVVGTTVQNFSQEIVQEFQIGLSNFSLSTGASASGSVNVVSKSGSNDFRGNAFLYYRDDKFAAFPALSRLDAANGIPPAARATRVPFDRQQFGGTLGGPIVKDKLFFFSSYERNNQDGSSLRNPTLTSFAGFSSNPFDETLFTGKIDWIVNDRSNVFFRYSFNDNIQQGAFPAGSGIVPRDSVNGLFTSNDQIVTNRSHGFTSGLTYSFSPSVSNNFVFNFSDFDNAINPAIENTPEIRLIFDPNWRAGTNAITPQTTLQKRYQLRDDLTWISGNHIFNFGANYERTAIGGQFTFANPVRIRLYDPAGETEADFLNADVFDISMGIGDPNLPFNDDGDTKNNRIQFYAGDTWRITPRFTLNYGLAYRWDSNLWNHDLRRPELIAGLFDDGTAPSKRDNNNIAPRIGFAWDVAGSGKTVIRGGFGMYYDNTIDNLRLFERADLGPAGAQQFLVGGGLSSPILAPYGGIGVFDPGQITLAEMLALYPSIRSQLEASVNDCTAPTIIECTGNISGPIFSSNFQVPYSLQYSIGVQHELPYDLLLQVDYNFRKGLHEVLVYDANRFDSVTGPRLATFDGPVPYADSSGFSTYSGILARVDRRFRNGFQFTASYALSRFKAFGGDTLGLGAGLTNLDNFRDDFGPSGLDRTHRFVFSAIYELPFYKNDGNFLKRNLLGNWTVSLISTAFSGVPQSLFLPDNINLNGTGEFIPTYLPGTRAGSIGRDIKTVDEVNALIRDYNANFAGGVDAFGRTLNPLAELPSDTQIGGDSVISQDVRLSKTIKFNERFKLSLIGEVFNVFNVANLVNVGDFIVPTQADADAFGITTLRPTQRTTSVFGTGGPRSFQFGLRFGF